MVVQALAVMGSISKSLLSQGVALGSPPYVCHISQLTPPIEVILSIVVFEHHELFIAHGLTLVTPTLRGWEAFSILGALTHTRITQALSQMATQISSGTLGSSLGSWCCEHLSLRGARQTQNILRFVRIATKHGVFFIDFFFPKTCQNSPTKAREKKSIIHVHANFYWRSK